jgi:hypothetical protein
MNTHRYRAPGRLTNYELTQVRAHCASFNPRPTRISWQALWQSLSCPVHFTSYADFCAKREQGETDAHSDAG